MSEQILEVIEKLIDLKLQKLFLGEIGIVTEVFPHKDKSDFSNYSCHVKLKNPDSSGNFLELRHVPVATHHIGTVAIPNVGDMVYLSFIQGSVHQPIITGRLYHSEMRPPVGDVDEIIQQLPPGEKKDKEVIKISMRNHPKVPTREIILEMVPDCKIQIDESQVSIELQDKKTKFCMKHKKDEKGTIELSSKKTMIQLKEDGDILLKTPGSITLNAQKDITLQATNIQLKSKKDIKAEAGVTAELKAKLTNIKADAVATVDGPIVKIKS